MLGNLLTVEEVAEKLRTTPSAIHSQRYRGQKPGALGHQVGRRLLFSEADLEDWWRSQNGNGGEATSTTAASSALLPGEVERQPSPDQARTT